MLLKLFLFLIVVIFLAGSCDPPRQFCDDMGRYAILDDYYSLVPRQEVYTQGEKVLYKIEIPSVNTFYGDTVDIFGETRDSKPLLTAGADDLYLGNKVTLIRGYQGSYRNQFYMEYSEGVYYLEFTIELIRLGVYQLETGQRIDFVGKGDCNFYYMDVYLKNSAPEHELSFEVVE